MNIKLKWTKKLSISFLLFLFFFTFCSRSIFYILTPKVQIESTKSGKIINHQSFNTIETYFTDVDSIRLPYNFEKGLYVKKSLRTRAKM